MGKRTVDIPEHLIVLTESDNLRLHSPQLQHHYLIGTVVCGTRWWSEV